MIDFSNKIYSNILKEMLDKVPNSYDKREGSIIQTAVGPASYAFEEFYLTLNQVQRASFVQTAVGTSLDKIAVIANINARAFNQSCHLVLRFAAERAAYFIVPVIRHLNTSIS